MSDGYNNSRVAKFDKNGNWVKALGERGSAPNQFNTPHGITVDTTGNIYVADRGNRRVQVFNPDLKPLAHHRGHGRAVVAVHHARRQAVPVQRRRQRQDLQVRSRRQAARLGADHQNHGQNGCLVHELHCESDTVLYKGDCSTWQVEKLTIAN